MIKIISTVLATLTLLADIIVVLAFIAWIVSRFKKLHFIEPLLAVIRKYAIELLLVPPLLATLGSLYFSELAHWTPCKLCWFQRIMMYPQIILLATALWRRSKEIIVYLIPLSAIGAVISAVHYTEQIRARLAPLDPLAPCDASGISCAKSYAMYYDYITVPMMAFSAFLLILMIALIARSKK